MNTLKKKKNSLIELFESGKRYFIKRLSFLFWWSLKKHASKFKIYCEEKHQQNSYISSHFWSCTILYVWLRSERAGHKLCASTRALCKTIAFSSSTGKHKRVHFQVPFKIQESSTEIQLIRRARPNLTESILFSAWAKRNHRITSSGDSGVSLSQSRVSKSKCWLTEWHQLKGSGPYYKIKLIYPTQDFNQLLK